MTLPGARPHWSLSPLDPAMRPHRAPKGTAFRGWRLRPGLVVDTARLIDGLTDAADDALVLDRIAAATRTDPHLEDALAALAGCDSVTAAARATGLGLRSLQRCVVGATGRPPVWWHRLARARRAALSLASETPAEVAAGAGYSDQAHLTRELRAFFAATPGQVRRGEGPYIGIGYGA